MVSITQTAVNPASFDLPCGSILCLVPSVTREVPPLTLPGSLEIERQRLQSCGVSPDIALSIQNSNKKDTLKMYERL